MASATDSGTRPDSRPAAVWHWLGRHREAAMWTAVVVVVLTMQWPMLKGYYYRLTGAVPPPTSIEWRTDLDGALAESKRRGLPVLLDAGADWCPPCIAMKHDVWPDAEVAALVNDRFVPLLVDVDRTPETAARYGIDTIPTLLVLDGDGAVLRTAGYLPKPGLIRFLTDPRWDD